MTVTKVYIDVCENMDINFGIPYSVLTPLVE